MKKQVTKYYILLFLVALFAAPGLAAYLFYQHPNWLSAAKVNKGSLLNPPLKLSSLNAQSKWLIIFWSPNGCGQNCLKQLDVLARVRLALGRKLYSVDQKLILGSSSPSPSEPLKLVLQKQDFDWVQLKEEDKTRLATLSSGSKIFIANPDNFLVMSYQPNGNPDDIYKDLKLLLNTTERKSGH